MKKMTCLSAISCVSWLSCNNKPENPANQIAGKNPVVVPESKVEEFYDKIKAFKHVDNNNLFEFIQTIEDFEKNGGKKVTVKKATIQDNKLTFEILGVKGTINLMINETVSEKQKQFDCNIDAIQWLNDRGGELVFPLNINTLSFEFIIFFDYLGPNLDKIKKINGNNLNKKFSIEKGVVKLDGNDCFKLDSVDYFSVLAGCLSNKSRHCFFDDTFFQNPITWQPNGTISFYGGENCVLFEEDFWDLNELVKDLVSMQKVGIPIDKIKIEQESQSIKLGGSSLGEDIWTNYVFWDSLRRYTDLFYFGDGIKIKEENDFFSINNKPIKKRGQLIKNIEKNKDYFTKNSMFKLVQAN